MPTGVKDQETPAFRSWSGVIGRKQYEFKELSVKETDDALESSKGPDGTSNGRLLMRFMVAKASVSPKLTLDDLAALPQRVYLRMCDVINGLNDEDETDDEEELANATKA